VVLLAAVTGAAQAQRFEVASVRPGLPVTGVEGRGGSSMTVTPDRIILRNYPLIGCIQWAYDVKEYQVAEREALYRDRYEINAKAGGPVSREEMRGMLRTLLAERFGLLLHRESRDLGVYALVAAKGGLKLRESEPETETGKEEFRPGLKVAFRAYRIADLAEFLSTLIAIGRPVIDGTGLDRRYTFTLDLNEAVRQPEGGPSIPRYCRSS
jgi:uncharacterized protein (TIGR03435 family)